MELKDQTQQIGAAAELRAAATLIDRGYYVFRNVSPIGPVDLVAIKDNEVLLIDVKKSHPGDLGIKGCPTDTQKMLGVEIAKVDEYGNLVTGVRAYIINQPLPTFEKVCPYCNTKFKFFKKNDKKIFCSTKCKNKYRAFKEKPKPDAFGY